MKRFLLALQFLTVLPITVKGKAAARDVGASLRYFPVVGILIGLMISCVGLLGFILPSTVAAVLIVLSLLVITGGLHVDGLADTCDGFYGMRTKEDRLRIMKDSCVGAMGVIGISISLLLRCFIISEIPASNMWKVLIVMVVCGRWAQVFACYIGSYSRGNGTAQDFIKYAGKTEIIFATVVTLLMAFSLMGVAGLWVFCAQALCGYFFARFCNYKIGGITGDTIGAINEIAEICVLLSAYICMGIMYGA